MVFENAPTEHNQDQIETELIGEKSRGHNHIETLVPGDTFLDHFEVVKRLGIGGSAVVYLVRHQFTNHLFSVKVPKVAVMRNEVKQRMQMREIRTWIDLPDHPNLAKCRFIRTLNRKFVIFSEFVDGASLHQIIGSGVTDNFERLLDFGIQIGWGLQAAHECGVVHRDIKPGNVLVDHSGTAKITDFGLARMHQSDDDYTRDPDGNSPSSSPLESTGYMTPAYCSPEQNKCIGVDYRTDIWSYGLTLFTMLAGEPTWINGIMAPDLLKGYERLFVQMRGRPSISSRIYRLLDRCFQKDPDARWQSVDQISEELLLIYRETIGRDYARRKPAFTVKHIVPEPVVRSVLDQEESISQIWYSKASQLNQRDESSMDRNGADGSRTRRSRMLTHIERFEQATEMYMRSIEAGHTEHLADYATLLMMKSEHHGTLSDHSGQIETLELAVEALERRQELDRSNHLKTLLADAFLRIARARDCLHQFEEAIRIFDRSIAMIKGIPKDARSSADLAVLAKAYVSQGSVLMHIGDFNESQEDITRGIDLIESNKTCFASAEYIELASVAYLNLASTSWSSGQVDKAIALFERSIELVKSDSGYRKNVESLHRIAMAKTNIGLCYYTNKRFSHAKRCMDEALEFVSELVLNMDQDQYSSDLVLVWFNSAAILQEMRDDQAALKLLNRAIDFHENLVFRDGRNELFDQQALLYHSKATSLRRTGSPSEAIELFDKSLKIWNYIYERQEGMQVLDNAVNSRENKADVLYDLGRYPEALQELTTAAENLELLIFTFDRLDSKTILNRITLKRSYILKLLNRHSDAAETLSRYYEKVSLCPESSNISLTETWELRIKGLID